MRIHPIPRAIGAVLGVAVLLASAAPFIGVKVAWLSGFGIVTFFIVAPWLLWVATLSGSRFALEFAPPPPSPGKALEERREAEKQFEKSNAPEDALKVDLARLNEYYVINQNQARSSFRWAKFSMLVGFGTIVAGIWLFYFRNMQPDKFMAALSTAAGLVINLISVLFFRLYLKTQVTSLYYYEQLAGLQRLSVAIRLVEAHTEADKQAEARNLVIRELLRTSQTEGTRLIEPTRES